MVCAKWDYSKSEQRVSRYEYSKKKIVCSIYFISFYTLFTSICDWYWHTISTMFATNMNVASHRMYFLSIIAGAMQSLYTICCFSLLLFRNHLFFRSQSNHIFPIFIAFAKCNGKKQKITTHSSQSSPSKNTASAKQLNLPSHVKMDLVARVRSRAHVKRKYEENENSISMLLRKDLNRQMY